MSVTCVHTHCAGACASMHTSNFSHKHKHKYVSGAGQAEVAWQHGTCSEIACVGQRTHQSPVRLWSAMPRRNGDLLPSPALQFVAFTPYNAPQASQCNKGAGLLRKDTLRIEGPRRIQRNKKSTKQKRRANADRKCKTVNTHKGSFNATKSAN